jgi:CO/xanthine dehydrogenase FAD-binding subunit
MLDFDYYQPRSTDELTQLLARTGGKVVAGGTDLLPRMRQRQERYPSLVDISRLPLDGIRLEQGWLRIGALATHAGLVASGLIQAWAPALAAAAASVGCPQTRRRGTLGGNLANASPAADTAPPLLALEAEAGLNGLQGPRRVPLAAFFLGPGRTCLAPGEYLEEVRLPCPDGRWGAGFQKLGRRNGMAIAVVSAAACLALDNRGRVRAARLALGSVAPCPVRSPHAEALLAGQSPGPELFRQAGLAALADLAPVDDIRASARYRLAAAAVVAARALALAFDQALRRQP